MANETDFEICLRKGLIKKASISEKIIEQSIKQAELFLEEASNQIESDRKAMALLALYNSLFHCARGLLYSEGYTEHSHFCLQQFILHKAKENNNFTIEDAKLFDLLRGIKMEVQYSFSRTYLQANLEELYNQTEEFIEKTKKFIEEKNKTN
jgi:uncharacterized protein (UPF0332 family)